MHIYHSEILLRHGYQIQHSLSEPKYASKIEKSAYKKLFFKSDYLMLSEWTLPFF